MSKKNDVVNYDLWVAGKLHRTGGLDEIVELGKTLSAEYYADNQRVAVVVKRHDEVAGNAVEIDEEKVARSLSNLEAIAEAKAGAWRRFEGADRGARVKMLAEAAAGLAGSPATKNLDLPKYVLAGRVMTQKQVRFVIQRYAEFVHSRS